MKFELQYKNMPCGLAFGLLGEFEPHRSGGHGFVIEPRVADIDEVVTKCPECGSQDVLIEARQDGEDPLRWLRGQPTTDQSSYLALRRTQPRTLHR